MLYCGDLGTAKQLETPLATAPTRLDLGTRPRWAAESRSGGCVDCCVPGPGASVAGSCSADRSTGTAATSLANDTGLSNRRPRRWERRAFKMGKYSKASLAETLRRTGFGGISDSSEVLVSRRWQHTPAASRPVAGPRSPAPRVPQYRRGSRLTSDRWYKSNGGRAGWGEIPLCTHRPTVPACTA